MPRGIHMLGRRLSDETKNKIRENSAKYWLGKHLTEDAKKKISLAKKGKPTWIKKGHIFSEEHLRRIKESKQGERNNRFGIKLAVETRRKMSRSAKKGCESNLWRGGVREWHQAIRDSFGYKIWRELVFDRDGYKCTRCGIKSGWNSEVKRKIKIEAHHLKRFSEYPDERFSLENGITLCTECHRKTDNYGRQKKL